MQFTLDNFLAECEAENGEIVLQMLKDMMKNGETCAVTGKQNSGKSSLILSMVQYIDDYLVIKSIDSTLVTKLREYYPTRDIIQYNSCKKSNKVDYDILSDEFYVYIPGELPTDKDTGFMIEVGSNDAEFTLFEYHTHTTIDLINSLRDAFVLCVGATENAPEKIVMDFVRFDINLATASDGTRYISRITEIFYLLSDPSTIRTRDLVVYDTNLRMYVKQDCYYLVYDI